MSETRLFHYSYDPLDRLVGTSSVTDAKTQRFYCKSRLVTEIQGQLKHSIFQYEDQILAQQNSGGTTVDTQLLTTDQQRSVLGTVDTNTQPITYTPYGFRSATSGLLSLLGFNGERRDPLTGCYMLGNGYRPFSPVLMRFYISDSWSPFGKGGLNAYAYCLGNPVNRRDPNGHVSLLGSFIQFAEQAFKGRRTILPKIVGSISPRRRLPPTPITPASLAPITMPPFTYHPMGGSMRIQNRPGLSGSLESIASTRSTNSVESMPSALSARSLGSNSSISSSGSTRSTATTSSSSRRSSVSADSDWSGSGRRHDSEWGSNESISSVSSYSSEFAPRVVFEDTLLTLDAQGNVSYLPGPSTPGLQIRRPTGQ